MTPHKTFTSLQPFHPGTLALRSCSPRIPLSGGTRTRKAGCSNVPEKTPPSIALSPGLKSCSLHKRAGPAKLSWPYLAGCHPPTHPQTRSPAARAVSTGGLLPQPGQTKPRRPGRLASLRTRAAALLPGPHPERRRRRHFPRPWRRGSWQRGSWRSGSERR